MHIPKIVLLILFTAMLVTAQDETDAVRPFLYDLGPGARAMGMGQAYSAVASDASALYHNPAGLANIVHAEFNLEYGGLTTRSSVKADSASGDSDSSVGRLSNISLAFPVIGTSITFAFGYHQLRAFDRQIFIRDRTVTPNSEQITSIEGRMGEWSAGFGYQVSRQLSLGIALNALTGKSNYSDEIYLPSAGVLQRDTYETIEPGYSGIGIRAGTLFSPLPSIHIGLLVDSPLNLKVEEDYESDLYELTVYEYSIRTPLKLQVGISYSLGPLLLAGGFSQFDYSELRFNSDIEDYDGAPLELEINRALRTNYASVLSYGLGGEFLLPFQNIKIRAGYHNDPSIYKDSALGSQRTTYTAGISFVPVPQAKIDIGWSAFRYDRDMTLYLASGSTAIASETVSASDLRVALIFRF